MPVPREIFRELDRFTHSNWRALQRPELARWRPSGVQAQNALLFGAVVAEGFVAVEAEDLAETKNIGRAVPTLARGLGIEKAALRRSRSIIDHAGSGDWIGVRKEWDGVMPDVQQGMDEIRSEQLAQLVSLGGWLRGLEIPARSSRKITRRTTPACCGNLPCWILRKELANMSDNVREDPIVLRMKDGIATMRKVLGPGDAPLSEEKVQKMSRL